MLYQNGKNSKILLTTPDYPPKLGGLSTFTKSIERTLNQLGLSFDVLVWDQVKELKEPSLLPHSYEWGIHIHFFGSHYLQGKCRQHINFIHGSEILFTSPHLLKRIFKKLTKGFFLRRLQGSYLNFFISEFSLELIQSKGFSVNYGRDIVFHNCIKIEGAKFKAKSLNDSELKLICVARDVPHKNIKAAVDCAVALAEVTSKKVTLFLTKEVKRHHLIDVVNISNISDGERNTLLRECHFNLLLSLDHRKRGFVEGFGLTVLEAGIQGTPSIVSPFGGLTEAVHDRNTGWVCSPIKSSFVNLFKKISEQEYSKVSKNCYEHTISSHDETHYQRLLGRVLGVDQ